MTDVQAVIEDIYTHRKSVPNTGEVATYIRELIGIDENNFGSYMNFIDDANFQAGDWQKGLSIF